VAENSYSGVRLIVEMNRRNVFSSIFIKEKRVKLLRSDEGRWIGVSLPRGKCDDKAGGVESPKFPFNQKQSKFISVLSFKPFTTNSNSKIKT